MYLDNLSHQRQANAKATLSARARGIGLNEEIEHVRQDSRRDTGAVVTNGNYRLAIDHRQGEDDVSAAVRVFGCIVQQVPEDLLRSGPFLKTTPQRARPS